VAVVAVDENNWLVAVRYSEDTPVQRLGLFGWRRIVADHLNDCAIQRRVFREAINEVRVEIREEIRGMREQFLGNVANMHAQNQAAIKTLAEEIANMQKAYLVTMRWMLGGVIASLAVVAGWAISHLPVFAHL
jgi:hypothetical protein